MKRKVALIDIDGIITDSTERFARAEQAKQEYLSSELADAKEVNNIYWKTAFTPELVSLDTLIDGVPEALDQIEKAGYMVLFLTSRPESMRQATIDWFWSHTPEIVLLSDEHLNQLIMKPASQQFVKTIVWKTGVAALLAELFDVAEMLFVDDEVTTLQSVVSAGIECKLYVAPSLKDAVKAIKSINEPKV